MYCGHAIYAFTNGRTYNFFDIMYLLLHSCSDSIIIVLLVLMSFGWTTTFNQHKDYEISIAVGTMFTLLYIIVTVLNKLTDDAYDKYHMFDGIPAYMMLFFRMCAFGCFLLGIIRSIVHLKP